MSAQSGDFLFSDSISAFSGVEDFVARVPAGISTREQVFDVLGRELKFPSYFGKTWDALWDCLSDLSWIARHRVIIAHDGIPDLDPVALRTYFELLAQCIRQWKPGERHQLLVAFPERAEAEIRRIITDGHSASRS
ncbi:MAG: barstar family protein [Thermoguttaceae bacterium]